MLRLLNSEPLSQPMDNLRPVPGEQLRQASPTRRRCTCPDRCNRVSGRPLPVAPLVIPGGRGGVGHDLDDVDDKAVEEDHTPCPAPSSPSTGTRLHQAPARGPANDNS